MNADKARLRRDIETNAEFGAIDVDEGRARTVLTGTTADQDAREYLVDRMEDAGLQVRIDPVGNVAGRWTPETADPSAAAVAAGSHLDSVPEGGIFDGPLGVYAALEAVRTLQECDSELSRPLDVVCFTEEEGQRFDALTGSAAACGRRDVSELLSQTDDEGTTLEDSLTDIGFSGSDTVDASAWEGWLELHVEQSTSLEAAGVPVGVVSHITGLVDIEVEIRGEANHAGTTPMGDRRDALAAAAEVILDVERDATEKVHSTSDAAVGTVGKAVVRPNGANAVPGEVSLGVDVRDVERASMESLVDQLRECLARLEAERSVSTSLERTVDVDPVPLSGRCRRVTERAAADAGIDCVTLHSGAGHDTMHVAEVTDAGMLFAPSRDGVSHSPLEWTDWEDCALATTVLARSLERLASS